MYRCYASELGGGSCQHAGRRSCSRPGKSGQATARHDAKPWRAGRYYRARLTSPAASRVLVALDRGAGTLKLAIGLFRGLLVDAIKQRLVRAVHEVLRLLQTQAGQGAD